ncbi:MAG TPA: alpha/beta fold hydrolase [Noviherbaspirillum sp.]|nr:alpha/beta fold hydrolase [Noviherbaspirillum sp.]
MTSPDPVDMAALAFLQPQQGSPNPARVESPDEWVETAEGRIAVWRRGAGKRVLLVHGWAGSHGDLHAFVAPLAAAGCEVIAIDLPAHGMSDGRIASIPDLARALLHVAGRYGPLCGVVAHSVGCAAVGVALRDGLPAPRTVLIAPPARYADFASDFARMVGIDPQALLDALRRRDIDVDGIDFPAMAPRLASRALIIHSRDDRVVPYANGEALAAAWPGSGFLSCEGLGHGRILADAAVIEHAVRFLTD